MKTEKIETIKKIIENKKVDINMYAGMDLDIQQFAALARIVQSDPEFLVEIENCLNGEYLQSSRSVWECSLEALDCDDIAWHCDSCYVEYEHCNVGHECPTCC